MIHLGGEEWRQQESAPRYPAWMMNIVAITPHIPQGAAASSGRVLCPPRSALLTMH